MNDKFFKAEQELCYQLDKMLYLPYKKELDGTRFGYDKEIFKQKIVEIIEELKKNNSIKAETVVINCELSNDSVTEIKCFGRSPYYLGFDFHIRKENSVEYVEFIKKMLEKYNRPVRLSK